MAEPSETTHQHGGNANWRQFWLLLWKNWLLQKKKKIKTVFLVLFPIVLPLTLVLLRNSMEHQLVEANIYLSFFVTTNLREVRKDQTEKFIVAYAPNTALVERIVNRMAMIMGVRITTGLGFASETALEDHATMDEDIFGAIVFVKSDWVSLPKNISYKIRLRSDKKSILKLWTDRWTIRWNTDATYANRPRHDMEPVYEEEGFLAIQKAVDLSLIAEVNASFDPTTTNVRTQLKQYPFPPCSIDLMIDVISFFLPLIILLSFIIIAPTICQEIVLEKENKFKESMKLMGMRMWLYWSSWFVKYLLFMLTTVVIMTYLFHAPITHNGPVLGHGSATVTFVFLLLYSLSLITFCFAMSTLVSKASFGTAIGLILFILLYTPFFYLGRIYDDMTLVQKIGSSVDFNLAMAYGCLKIAQHEALGIGAHWSTIWSSGDGHTMGHILIMLLVDTIIYSMLTWYLDAVIPGEFGTTQQFYFPFTKEYWVGRKRDKIKLSNEDFMTLVPEDKRPYFETPLQNAKAGIQIRGLTKSFGSKANPAVNNLNIDMYEGNITALLGHNGAGKTTTMFMLTGFLPPSKGTAYINGFDITREMDEIRENLGLCPQHNILFDTLTVSEHLLFFAILKGSPITMAYLEMNEMIKVLHMEEKINAEAKTLSGGQKRTLSVGIALIAGSKFVILDEPTSGMDPEARRQTWDILQSQRNDRTMTLSTHYMDEADLLGDRIAIMSNGEIQCYGTPMFLKNKYGVGYHLTIVKTSTCDVDQLRDVIKSQIPMAHMVSNEAAEVTFLLPSNQASTFESLFETLETDGKTLGIHSFGVSVTTMEEVFLRVKDSSALEGGRKTSIAVDAELQGNNSHADVLYRKETGWKRQNLQLHAMLYKRLIHSIRNYALTLSQILIPVLFTILACCVFLNPPRDDSNFKDLTLDLTNFKSPITPYDVQPPQSANALKLSSCYFTSVSRQSKPVFINSELVNSTMDDYLIGIGKDHRDQYNWNYQIGATIEEDTDGKLSITGFFNSQAYHTIAISLSYLGNTLMKCYGSKDYQIETINHPLPRNFSEQVMESPFGRKFKGFGFSLLVSFGLAILFPTFLVFLMKERKSGAKHSQLVSGVRLHNFWLATFIWDYVNYLVPCILIIVVILGFQIDGYWQNSWVIFIGLMVYGFSLLPFTYVMSFLFGEASSGCVWLSVIGIITGILTSLVIFILQLPLPQFLRVLPTVEWIFYTFFPTYCFSAVLQNIYSNYNNHKVCSGIAPGGKLDDFCASLKRSNPCCPGNCGESCEFVDNYLSWTLPGIGRPLFFMVLQDIVFFLILYIIEIDIVGRLLKLMARNRVSQAMLTEMNADEDARISEDSDVANERQRIHSNPIEELVKTDAVVIQDLTKLYGNFVAVNQLSIGVSQKECFGLLGVNGAGKTTVFKMLTGEIRPSFGSAYIAGKSVEDDLAQVRQKIGYCAQFDSIIDQMTVHETLWMYACAHGIPAEVRQEVIDRLIERLTLKPYTDKQAGKLSGGNKRKLCVAVALMGNPTVVFLDEPTTGVDPEARRHVWNTLAAARNAGATIILTSHSMEECEAICTRMGILVNGRFLCLGSLQHLRDKFGVGYTLSIKLQRSEASETSEELQERIEKLKTFISRTFPESVLKDHHENLLSYQVKTRSFKWSEIFRMMEKSKKTYQIEDFSVEQTTLEQLFIGFARLQKGPREISKKCLGLC